MTMMLHCNLLYLCIFFFFQAEDGIRDIGVTGVQTCALPISSRMSTLVTRDAHVKMDIRNMVSPGARRQTIVAMKLTPPRIRSEERRVGKECRSRWSPYH